MTALKFMQVKYCNTNLVMFDHALKHCKIEFSVKFGTRSSLIIDDYISSYMYKLNEFLHSIWQSSVTRILYTLNS